MNYKKPFLIIITEPQPAPMLERFFHRDDNQIVDLLEKPHCLRRMGWNMSTLDDAHISEGKYWEVKNSDRKTHKLYRTGIFATSAQLDADFLGHGMSQADFAQRPTVNPLALVEYVYEYCRLYTEILNVGNPNYAGELNITIAIVGSQTYGKLQLSTGHVHDPFMHMSNYTAEIKKDFEGIVKVPITSNSDLDPKKIAFEVLSFLYESVNVSPNDIPYTNSKDQVDVDRIIKVG